MSTDEQPHRRHLPPALRPLAETLETHRRLELCQAWDRAMEDWSPTVRGYVWQPAGGMSQALRFFVRHVRQAHGMQRLPTYLERAARIAYDASDPLTLMGQSLGEP